MSLQIHLLGPIQISRDGQSIEIPGHKPLALLAYLLLTRQANSRQHLSDLLFDGPSDPKAALRWTLSKLRGTIGADYIVADRHEIAFDFDSYGVGIFEECRISWYASTSIIGDIDICSAVVSFTGIK